MKKVFEEPYGSIFAVTPPTNKEIRMTIRQIKSGRATAVGPENIPAEALRLDIELTANMFHVLFRRI